jgi:hypothetical protein
MTAYATVASFSYWKASFWFPESLVAEYKGANHASRTSSGPLFWAGQPAEQSWVTGSWPVDEASQAMPR